MKVSINIDKKVLVVTGACLVGGLIGVSIISKRYNELASAMNKYSDTGNKLCNKLDASIDEVSKMTQLDITNEIINKGVEKKIEESVGDAIISASESAVRELKDSMASELRKKVEHEVSLNSNMVTDKLNEIVNNIDVEDFKKEVMNSAKADMSKKLDKDMERLLSSYGDKLNDMLAMYGRFQSFFDKKNGRFDGYYGRF